MTEILDEDTIALVRRLRDTRREAAKLKRDEKELRLELMERMLRLKTNEGVTASGAPVTHITSAPRPYLDPKKVEAKYPEVYADCLEDRTTVTVHTDIED